MMPHIITQILALIISGLHLLFIGMPSDSSWRDSDYGLVGASYNCLALLLYPCFILGYAIVRTKFTSGSVVLTISAVLAIILEYPNGFMLPMIGVAGVILHWFTFIYPFVLCYRLIIKKSTNEKNTFPSIKS